ncbi:MAG: YkgJ family cysteine cluster protein [Acidobacteriota bacterium]
MTHLPQLPDAPETGQEWYRDGVRFRCLGVECGRCCSGRMGPGAVWVNRREISQLAEHLEIPIVEFKRRFVRRLQGRFSLRERSNYDCIFYREGTGCSVYEARPGQCRTYPFWPRIMATETTWQIEAEHCPGIGYDATRVAARDIRQQLEPGAHQQGGPMPLSETRSRDTAE